MPEDEAAPSPKLLGVEDIQGEREREMVFAEEAIGRWGHARSGLGFDPNGPAWPRGSHGVTWEMISAARRIATGAGQFT